MAKAKKPRGAVQKSQHVRSPKSKTGNGGNKAAGRLLCDYDVKALKQEAEYLKGSITKKKNKTLVLMSRNPTCHTRHLMKNILQMIPNVKKEAKFNARDGLDELTEIAKSSDTSMVMFLQTVKHRDYYMWLSHVPEGPSVKFQVHNIHNIQEMKTIGNALEFSRPVLSFSNEFKTRTELKLIASMLSNVFNVPLYHRMSKPFVDRVLHFSWKDSKIIFRHYQIEPYQDTDAEVPDHIELKEIGPRFTLDPIRIFGKCLGGPTLYKNQNYMSPVELRRAMTVEASQRARMRIHNNKQRDSLLQEKVFVNEDDLDVQNVFSDVESGESSEEESNE